MKALENLPQGDPGSCILFILFLNDYVSLVINLEFGSALSIDFSNFADDCTLEMQAQPIPSKLTNKLKYDLRKALQMEMDHFYQFTLDNKLVLKTTKCSTVTFSNKNDFKAYVYKLDKNKLKLIHTIEHAPRKCVHSERYVYSMENEMIENEDGNIKYASDDSNELSDLEYLDINGTHQFFLP